MTGVCFLLQVALCGRIAAVSPHPPTVELTWDEVPGADYCLHAVMRPGKGVVIGGRYTEYVENVADAGIIGSGRQYTFDGTCPSIQGLDRLTLEDVKDWEINSAVGGKWSDPPSRRAASAQYNGQSRLHIPSQVQLMWSEVPKAQYCLHLQIKPGRGWKINGRYTENIENVVNSQLLGSRRSFIFDGACPSRPDLGLVDLADIERFEIDSAYEGRWGERAFRNASIVEYIGQPTITFRFPITVRWNEIPGATYRVHVRTKSNETLRDWASADLVDDCLYTVFDGLSPSRTDLPEVAFADLDGFEVEAMVEGEPVDHAFGAYDGRTRRVFCDFPSSPLTGMRSRLVQECMADPDIFRDGGRFILSGTAPWDTRHVPIYVTDGVTLSPLEADFRLAGHYEPSNPESPAYDPAFTYHHLWGPEIAMWRGRRCLFLSAVRLPRGASPDDTRFIDTGTCFLAPDSGDLEFGKMEPLDMGLPGLPRHTLDFEPPDTSGTPEKVKLDAVPYYGVKPARVVYTWFGNGNHVASYQIVANDPDIILHGDPSDYDDDQDIIEAPDVIRRGDYYYLFFSSGYFNSRYRLNCIMARSFENLTMEKGKVFPLTIPIERRKTTQVTFPFAERRHVPPERTGTYGATKMLENAGHSSVIEHEGEYYLFYHIGWFRDGAFDPPRDTYVCRLRFKPDGSIYRISY